MQDKKFRNSRDVTVILGASKIKDVKGWDLKEEPNKVFVKPFRGATTSQTKWHVKPTTEQNPKIIILHCGADDINDEPEPQNVAAEIIELSKLIIKDCKRNTAVSGIVSRYGKLNKMLRSVNCLLRVRCRRKEIRFIGHKNINPSKYLACILII